MGFETDKHKQKCYRNHGLWDIPMGFETKAWTSGAYEQEHYETSLWDLKLPTVGDEKADTFNYETSLWDLKPSEALRGIKKEVIMRHPYGIWNRQSQHRFAVSLLLWDIPMGFETRRRCSHYRLTHYYETSLWDLKRTEVGSAHHFNLIMRHPYGIWNRLFQM